MGDLSGEAKFNVSVTLPFAPDLQIFVSQTAGFSQLQTSHQSVYRYKIFGKSGDGGGYHSYLSIVPNLGFGLVVLTAEGSPPTSNYSRLIPETIAASAYEALIPAFRAAYSDLMAAKFAGNYTLPGAVATSDSLSSNHALVEVEDNILYLRDLDFGNVSALLRLDMLGWTPDSHSLYYSTPKGAALAPSDVGEGANFRIFAEAALCDYMDFAG